MHDMHDMKIDKTSGIIYENLFFFFFLHAINMDDSSFKRQGHKIAC